MYLTYIFGNQISHGSQRLVLMVLLLFLPLRLAPAQDFEKIEAKLEKSVAKGHLTQQQARAMMGALRRITDNNTNAVQQADSSGNQESTLATAENQIRRLVASGEMTEKDGRARMVEAREKLAVETAAAREAAASGKAELKEFSLKIRRAVQNGRITAEQGQARLKAFKQQLLSGSSQVGQDDESRLERVARRLKMAVENGDMTATEARIKYREIKLQSGDRDDDEAQKRDDNVGNER